MKNLISQLDTMYESIVSYGIMKNKYNEIKEILSIIDSLQNKIKQL